MTTEIDNNIFLFFRLYVKGASKEQAVKCKILQTLSIILLYIGQYTVGI